MIPWIYADIETIIDCYSTTPVPSTIQFSEEVYEQGYDTAGNYHWYGTLTGHHIIYSKEKQNLKENDNGKKSNR